MEHLLLLIPLVVGGALAWRMYLVVRSAEERESYVRVLRGIRLWMVGGAVLNIAIVLSVMLTLFHFVPLLRFGWWSALGGSGNVLLGQTESTISGGSKLALALALPIPVLLCLLFPVLALGEEYGYRYGSENLSLGERVFRQIKFGMIHLVVGIPIAAGIALTFSGLYYERIYLHRWRLHANEIAELRNRERPERLPYPATPSGPYDSAVWDEHMREFDTISDANRQSIDDWFDFIEERDRTIREKADDAVYVAASAHALSNLLIAAVLIIGLLLLLVS